MPEFLSYFTAEFNVIKQHCPTLSEESKVIMDADITEDELRSALNI